MAKLMLIGAMAQVEILTYPEDEELVLARCTEHSVFDGRLAPPGSCDWWETYDSHGDAIEYAADHADKGR